MISTNFAVSAAAVTPASTAQSAHRHNLISSPSAVTSLVTSESNIVKNLNNHSVTTNSSDSRNKMTNFSIADILNNDRSSSGLVRPTPPLNDTTLGKKGLSFYSMINICFCIYLKTMSKPEAITQ